MQRVINLMPLFEDWVCNPRLIKRMQREQARYVDGFGGAEYSAKVTSVSRSNRAFCHTQRMLTRYVYVDDSNLAQYDTYPNHVRIFDFGCGLGHTTFRLALELQLTGRTVEVGFFDIADHRELFADAVAEALGLWSLSYNSTIDVIVATEIFEHLDDPLDTLHYLDSRLVSGGRLITNVGDHQPSSLHITCDLSPLREYLKERYTEVVPNTIFVKR